MTSPVSRYATPAVNLDRDLSGRINQNTTPEEFDEVCREYGIVLERGQSFCGVSPLWHALHCYNWLLVDYIIDVGGKKLLDMGDGDRWTLLFGCFAYCIHLPGAIKLIKLGADVNMLMPATPGIAGGFPERNALWKLVMNMHCMALKAEYITLKFMLRNGAVAIPELDPWGKKIVEHAEKTMRAPLVSALSNDTFPLTMLPVLAEITASYVPVDEIVMNDEELEKEVAQVGALWEESPRQIVKI